MYVKKFEGDTLDEALKSVKADLGPDAIILKTITNKGLKGAFKKKRIEITAAISERTYERKAKVDQVLTTDQKDEFYESSAGHINQMIGQYNDEGSVDANSGGGYGNMGLNKVVNSVQKAKSKVKSKAKNSLDDFLSVKPEPFNQPRKERNNVVQEYSFNTEEEDLSQSIVHAPISAEHNTKAQSELDLEMKQLLKQQQNKIELLESKLFELTQNLSVTHPQKDEQQGLYRLRTILKTLDLDEVIIQSIIKKATFEFSPEQLENEDTVYEFALREITDSIKTSLPLFSSLEVQDQPVVTILMSDHASGQSSMALKLAVLNEDVKVIQFRTKDIDQVNNSFASQIFQLDLAVVTTVAEMMTECRKAKAAGQSIILDVKAIGKETDETKKIVDTIKRSFDHVEMLVTLSAINSEIYNRKIISKYQDLADGVIITYMDMCMNFGALINTHYAYNELPLKFYGNGPTIPDDIEAATAERLVVGLFQL